MFQPIPIEPFSSKMDSSNAVKESKSQEFNPYVNHNGTVLGIQFYKGISGPGFCLMAADTRFSEGYSIKTRNGSKITKLAEKTFIGFSGMLADFTELKKQLDARLRSYRYDIGKEPNPQSVAHMLSNTLYYRRFFPYYTFNIVGGLDENNNGIVFGYDAIGSYEPKPFVVQGSGSNILFPYLDAAILGKNKTQHKPLQTIEELVDLVLEAFNSLAERDIYTGDAVEIYIMQPSGISYNKYPLRCD